MLSKHVVCRSLYGVSRRAQTCSRMLKLHPVTVSRLASSKTEVTQSPRDDKQQKDKLHSENNNSVYGSYGYFQKLATQSSMSHYATPAPLEPDSQLNEEQAVFPTQSKDPVADEISEKDSIQNIASQHGQIYLDEDNMHNDKDNSGNVLESADTDLTQQVTRTYTENDILSSNAISKSSERNLNRIDLDEKHFDEEVLVDAEAETTVIVSKPKSKMKTLSFNLTPFVNESETLKALVNLGVDLSVVEKKPEAAEKILKLDFSRDVQPYLLFLRDVGVSDDHLGRFLTKNPYIFQDDIDDLQVRINYLESKKFSREMIASMVTRAPLFLLMTTDMMDRKLGYYQKQFKLTGNEVREVITKLPKLITWNMESVKDVRFYIKEFLGFSEVEMKKILLTCPKVYLTEKHQLGKKFDVLYNVMGITHQQMVQWPMIFRSRVFIIKQRHQFLQSIGRAQYDPTKEQYVSLRSLVWKSDEAWCSDVAKVPVEQFNEFLKTV